MSCVRWREPLPNRTIRVALVPMTPAVCAGAGVPPDNTARGQLERILYILPAAAGADGARLDQLAVALDTDVATVLRDLELVTARDFYHPAGAVDTFSIMIEHDSVHVHAPYEFRRPVRLSSREPLALGLGLRLLAAD